MCSSRARRVSALSPYTTKWRSAIRYSRWSSGPALCCNVGVYMWCGSHGVKAKIIIIYSPRIIPFHVGLSALVFRLSFIFVCLPFQFAHQKHTRAYVAHGVQIPTHTSSSLWIQKCSGRRATSPFLNKNLRHSLLTVCCV